MKKTVKKSLITATVLMVIGILILTLTACAADFDATKLITMSYEPKTYEIDEAFTNIIINANEADITLYQSEDGFARVIADESNRVKYSVTVNDGTLSIEIFDQRKWYDYISILSTAQTIGVYLPASEYASLTMNSSTGDVTVPNDFNFGSVDIKVSTAEVSFTASVDQNLKIKASTGDILANGIAAGTIDFSATTGNIIASDIICDADFISAISSGDHRITGVRCGGKMDVTSSTGKTYLTDITCKNFISEANTGDISLDRVIAEENICIERSTGDVSFNGCDAAELTIKTSTGSVVGTLLSDKIFITHTNTGDIDVPRGTSGGICDITTTTGDIESSIKDNGQMDFIL